MASIDLADGAHTIELTRVPFHIMRCHSTSWARYTSPEFWRGTTEGKDGYLFTTRAGRLLDQRNSLKALHGAGNRGGFHAFRRFRFAVLRKVGVLENLIKLWMGHSQNLMDLYAAQLRYHDTYRRGWCEKVGLGFGLGELGYKLEVPIRPALVA